MIAWIRELLTEFSPRALKASITVLAVVAFGTYVFSSGLGKDETLTIAKSPTASDVPKDIKSPKIFVHVAGSVKSPGIYKLDSGTRVFDAVLAAGGFTAKANQASVNMARALKVRPIIRYSQKVSHKGS